MGNEISFLIADSISWGLNERDKDIGSTYLNRTAANEWLTDWLFYERMHCTVQGD